MNNKQINTYGLNQSQISILEQNFGKENVADVTENAKMLWTQPAAAIVVKPELMSKTDMTVLNDTFKEDFNTAKILIPSQTHICDAGKSEELADNVPKYYKSHIGGYDISFMCYIESDVDNMTDTIKVIRKREAIPEEYESAVARMNKSLKAIESVFMPETDEYEAKINYIYKTADTFDRLTKLMEHIPELKIREKVPFRYMINSVLMAAMQASGILEEDVEFADDKTIGYHKDFIDELTVCISKYYNFSKQEVTNNDNKGYHKGTESSGY